MKNILERTWAVVLTIALSFIFGLLLLLLSNNYFEAFIPKTISGLLGAYLTISVIVNLMHKWFLKPSEDLSKINEIESLIDNKIDNVLLNTSKYGFDGLIDEMDFRSLFDSIGKGDVLWWLDTFSPGHSAWENHMKQALIRGANINMLVLSPKASLLIKNRAMELGGQYTEQRFLGDLQRFLDSMKHIRDETASAKGKLNIRLYDETLGIPIYVVTEKENAKYAYSSFYLCTPTAVSFPHIKWKSANQGGISTLSAYVLKKWERNANYTI